MKKYFSMLKEIRIGVLIFCALLSLFISWWCLRLPVNNKIRSLLPDYICTIKVLDEYNDQASPLSEVWIEGLILGTDEGIFENSSKITKNEGFELRKAEDFGYGCDVIVNTQGAGSELVFKWSGGKDNCIKFWKQSFSGIISVNITFGEETLLQDKLDLFSDQPDDRFEYLLNTPLNETVAPLKYVAAKFGVYFLGGLIIFIILSGIIGAVIQSGEHKKNDL